MGLTLCLATCIEISIIVILTPHRPIPHSHIYASRFYTISVYISYTYCNRGRYRYGRLGAGGMQGMEALREIFFFFTTPAVLASVGLGDGEQLEIAKRSGRVF